MPHDIRVITPPDFIELDGHGEVNLESSRQTLAQIARACMSSGIRHVLLDARQMHAKLSYREIGRLVSELSQLGIDPDYRLAILHRPREFDPAAFLASRASDRGWNIGAFDSFEEAFLWLNQEDGSRSLEAVRSPDQARSKS